MLKIPAEYVRDITPAKFKHISRQLPASLLDVSSATRNESGMRRTHMGSTTYQKVAAVHGTLYMIPHRCVTSE
jgi:hypothetical protein